MAIAPRSGREFHCRLAEALGLGGLGIQKIVLEVDINSVVKAYVKMLPDSKGLDKLCDVIKEGREGVKIVAVDEVEVKPDCAVEFSESPGLSLKAGDYIGKKVTSSAFEGIGGVFGFKIEPGKLLLHVYLPRRLEDTKLWVNVKDCFLYHK